MTIKNRPTDCGWELELENDVEIETEIGRINVKIETKHILNPPFYDGHKYETRVLFQHPQGIPNIVSHQKIGYQDKHDAVKGHAKIIEKLKIREFVLKPETYELKLGESK